MKKVAVVLMALMMLCLGAGCSGESADGKTTIKFFGWGSAFEINNFQAVIDEFEKDYPEYKVQYTASDAATYMTTLLSTNSRNFPDVFYMPDVNFLQTRSGKDIMLDLTPYVEASETLDLDDVYMKGIDAFRYDPDTKTFGTGAIWAFPKDLGPNVLTYNKDHVKSCGITIVSDAIGENYPYGYGYYTENGEVKKVLNDQIPMTWAQFLQFSIDSTTDRVIGLTHWPWEVVYISMGGRFLSDDYKEVTINNNQFAEAAQIAGDFYDWGAMPSVADQATQNSIQRFTSQLAAATFTEYWQLPTLWSQNFDFDILPIPVPNVSGIDKYTPGSERKVREELMIESVREGAKSTYELGCVGLAAYKNSRCPEGAYKLIEYLAYNEQGNMMLWKNGQSVPNLRSIAESFLTEENNDPLGLNRPNNRKVYLDMLETANRRVEAYTYDTEWYTNINQAPQDELKLNRVWKRDNTYVELWDWSRRTTQSPSGAQTFNKASATDTVSFLARLEEQVQSIYNNNFNAAGELLFKWETNTKV